MIAEYFGNIAEPTLVRRSLGKNRAELREPFDLRSNRVLIYEVGTWNFSVTTLDALECEEGRS